MRKNHPQSKHNTDNTCWKEQEIAIYQNELIPNVFDNDFPLTEMVTYETLKVNMSYKTHETYLEMKLNSYFKEKTKS